MRLEVQGVTDVGRRRQGNEDGMLVNDELGLLAVADGMGGHQAGEVASATALESLRASVASGMAIREAIETANAAVFEKASGDPALAGMGTTLTAGTLAAGDTLILGHVGDSRAYLLRDGELRQITEDHSLVEEMVRDGRITREQAEHHPQRSIITRALGVDSSVEVDVSPLDLREGDRILLCSDGLTTMVPEDAIAEILLGETDAHAAADRLIAAANAAGGDDNITAVIADFVPDRDRVPVAAPPSRPGGGRAARAEKTGRPRRRRRVLRTALIALPVLLIIGFGIAATAWYARSNYFVGLDGTTVTVYRGLPDGLLIWDPTVERTTDLDSDQLTEAQQQDLADGKQFSSKGSADEYVERLEESVKETEREQQLREEQQEQEEREQRQREQEQRERRQRRNRASSTTTTTTAPPAAPVP